MLDGDAAVAALTSVGRLNHHSDGNVRLHEGLHVARIHDIADAGDDVVVLLVDLDHFICALMVRLAKHLHL